MRNFGLSGRRTLGGVSNESAGPRTGANTTRANSFSLPGPSWRPIDPANLPDASRRQVFSSELAVPVEGVCVPSPSWDRPQLGSRLPSARNETASTSDQQFVVWSCSVRSLFGNPVVVASEMQGSYVPGRDKIVTPFKFSGCARHLWPVKTAACLADIASRDERTAKRWLAGEFEPPAVVFATMWIEMLKRESE